MQSQCIDRFLLINGGKDNLVCLFPLSSADNIILSVGLSCPEIGFASFCEKTCWHAGQKQTARGRRNQKARGLKQFPPILTCMPMHIYPSNDLSPMRF